MISARRARIAALCGPIFGASPNDRDIGVCQQIARLACQLHRMGEKPVGRCPAPLRIARREIVADIAERQRTQYRIGQRMDGDVGIAMAGQSLVMRDQQAAKP